MYFRWLVGTIKNMHPELIICVAAQLSFTRAIAINRDTLNAYYSLLKDALKENRLFSNLSHILHCDETGMALNPRKVSHIVAAKIHVTLLEELKLK